MFDKSKYLKPLKKIALGDWLGARALRNLGILTPAIWLLQQSLEKYLKVLRASGKNFISKSATFNTVGGNKIKLSIIKTAALRYADSRSLYYSDNHFISAEKLIKKIRRFLGDDVQSSTYDEWLKSGAPNLYSSNKKGEVGSVMKKVLSLMNKISNE